MPIAAMAFVVSGCSDEAAEEEVEQAGEASGEVLEGSISDAMIPLDELRSQAPRAPVVASSSSEAGETAEGLQDGETVSGQPGTAPVAVTAEPVLDLPPE